MFTLRLRFATILLLFLLLAQSPLTFGQVINSSNNGGDVCPNRVYTYSINTSCLVNWAVTGGTIQGASTNTNRISVIWNDIPTVQSTTPFSTNVRATLSGCSNPPLVQPASVFVSSISNVTPGPLTINGAAVFRQHALPFGDNAALTLRVPLVTLPQSSARAVPLHALTYEWVIPVNWRYNGTNIVSDGVTPRRFSGSPQAGNQITVTPAPGTGGTISVRAVNNNCINASTGPDNSLSQTLSLHVVRPTPSLTILSDRSPTGGNFTLNCGDQSDYRFRVVVGSIPSGGSFSNQAFRVSGQLAATGPLTGSNSVNTAFSGATGTAGISFQARYTRNGVSIDTEAPNVNVTIQSALTPISFASLPHRLCNGESATLRVNPVPGATRYTWTLAASGQLLTPVPPVSATGQEYVTTSPELPVTVRLNPSLYSYRAAVTVTAGSRACGNSRVTGTLTLGVADQINLYSSNRNSFQICAHQPIQFTVSLLGQQGEVTGYDWLVNEMPFNGPGSGSSTITVFTPAAGQRLSVLATVHSRCGDISRGLDVTTVGYIDGLPCEAAIIGATPPRPQVVAYPNPANTTLTLEQGGGTVRLADAYGKTVQSQTTSPGRLQLDTSRLPAGLYFLEMRDAKGTPVRQQIRIEH